MADDNRFTADIEALKALTLRLGGDFGRHELTQISSAARALSELAESGKSEQHIQRTTLAAQRFQQSLARARDSLAERESGGLQSLNEKRREGLKMEAGRYLLPTIEAFRNAPDQQTRLKWLEQAVEQGDGATLAAVADAPAFVSGVDAETLSKYLQHAEAKHLPGLAERRAQFERDREVISAALRQGETIAAKAVDLETIEAAERADKAEAELNSATG